MPDMPSVRVDFDLRTDNCADSILMDVLGKAVMAVILYARVSTAEQMGEHQEAQARAAGFAIDDVVADNGVAGLPTRLVERPEGRRPVDKPPRGDVVVVRWVDRLGRNYEDVCDVIREFMRRGVVIQTVINGMTFDGATKDPIQKAVRDALIAFMSATAQAQAEATKAAQRAGIAHARANDDRAYLVSVAKCVDSSEHGSVMPMNWA